jgi:hypothetical protein
MHRLGLRLSLRPCSEDWLGPNAYHVTRIRFGRRLGVTFRVLGLCPSVHLATYHPQPTSEVFPTTTDEGHRTAAASVQDPMTASVTQRTTTRHMTKMPSNQSLNHLLNFTLAPRQSQPAQALPRRSRKPASHQAVWHKESECLTICSVRICTTLIRRLQNL